MAKKSKTQKARASAARAQKKIEQEAKAGEAVLAAEAEEPEEQPAKKKLFKKAEAEEAAAPKPAPKPALEKKPESKAIKKEEKKPEKKKRRFAFFSDVRGEMRRVTWPTRQDVLRWSMVVVGALIFFGVFTAVFDSIFPQVLLVLSGLGVS